MAAGHAPGVTEQHSDLPTTGDSYNYELGSARQLDNADAMPRGGVSCLVRFESHGETSHKVGFISFFIHIKSIISAFKNLDLAV
jgi:hypothetical protein